MKHDSLISIKHFAAGALPRRSMSDEQLLRHDDPALLAVTDFAREHPATVDEERQIDDALADMVRLGVRALLVVRDQRITGLITSYDIQGEKPMQFLQSSTYNQHKDLSVAHIMTRWDDLLAVEWDHLKTAHAGDLLAVLEEAGVTHLLVVDSSVKGQAPTVRALVSKARLLRQLRGMRKAN
jgi:CBS domain-containing protein